MRDVAITGVGSTSFGKHDGRGLESLAVDAANTAIKSAGVERKEIGALYLGNFIAGPLSGQEVLAGIVAEFRPGPGRKLGRASPVDQLQ